MDWQSFFIGMVIGFVSIWVLWIWYSARLGRGIRESELRFKERLLEFHDHHDARMRRQNELIERIVTAMESQERRKVPPESEV